MLARHCNNLEWGLVTAPESASDPQRALRLVRRAVELAPTQALYLNTLGVAQYRASLNAEALATLERSLAANRGQFAAFDLFPLAMAHHRLGHREAACDGFDRAVNWLSEQKDLSDQYARELAAFRAEAEALLNVPLPPLPSEPFARGESARTP
jgi:tetratricopeptide (TPR) repeat protein